MMPSKLQEMGHDRAMQFIELYQSGMPTKGICKEMGWETKRPPQRCHSYLKRLRQRGYDIPTRMPNQNRKAQKH